MSLTCSDPDFNGILRCFDLFTRPFPPLIAAQMLVLLQKEKLLQVLQADHSQVLIQMRIDLGTRTNAGTSLLGTTGNGVTNILKYK